MKDVAFDRESIAMAVLMEAISQIGMTEIYQVSLAQGPEQPATKLAAISFAIADAMISEQEKGAAQDEK